MCRSRPSPRPPSTGWADSEQDAACLLAGCWTGIPDRCFDERRQRSRGGRALAGRRPGVSNAPAASERARAIELLGTARRKQRPSPRSRRSVAVGEAAEPPQVVDDRVHAVPVDELHGIVVHSLVLTHAVDRHDVPVVQPPGRARFELEPLELGGADAPESGRILSATWRPSDSWTAS